MRRRRPRATGSPSTPRSSRRSIRRRRSSRALAAINTAHNQVSSGDQPGAGRRRPEDRHVAARRRDRDAATRRPRSSRSLTLAAQLTELADAGTRRAATRTCATRASASCARRASSSRSRPGGGAVNFLIARRARRLVASFMLVPSRAGARAALRPLHRRRGAPVPSSIELFGKVRAVIDTPGLHCPWLFLGPFALLVHSSASGTSSICVSTRRTSEPGGQLRGGRADGHRRLVRDVVRDPVSYLYKNADPRGSLLRERVERHGAVPQRHEARSDARRAPRDESRRPRRGVGAVAAVGLRRRQRLHPQGPLPRRRR